MQRKDHWRAILLILAGLAFLLCLDAMGKYLGGVGVPVAATTWSRYVGHLLLVLLVFAPRDGRRLVQAQRPALQWARGVFMVLVTLFFYAALKDMPLAEGTALFFLAPLFTTGLSVWLLHERPGRWTWLAVLLGFAGVLVVVRPGSAVPLWSALLVVAAALSNACYQTLTRAASRSATHAERVSTQLYYSGMVGAVLLTLSLPFWWSSGWIGQVPWQALLIFASLGIWGALGHLLLIRAFQLATASSLAPWMYMQLLLSVGLSWLVFGHMPDHLTLIGMLVIGLAPQIARLQR